MDKVALKPERAAAMIADLCNRILILAPAAGLHVGIKIEPAKTRISSQGGER